MADQSECIRIGVRLRPLVPCEAGQPQCLRVRSDLSCGRLETWGTLGHFSRCAAHHVGYKVYRYTEILYIHIYIIIYICMLSHVTYAL